MATCVSHHLQDLTGLMLTLGKTHLADRIAAGYTLPAMSYRNPGEHAVSRPSLPCNYARTQSVMHLETETTTRKPSIFKHVTRVRQRKDAANRPASIYAEAISCRRRLAYRSGNDHLRRNAPLSVASAFEMTFSCSIHCVSPCVVVLLGTFRAGIPNKCCCMHHISQPGPGLARDLGNARRRLASLA